MNDTRTSEREEAAAGDAGTGGETRRSALYIYGVLPADVEIDPEAKGVGEPPTPVGLITHGEIAALVGEIAPGVRLGTPHDFAAHAQILDSAAVEVPVLPLRFGAVMTDRDAVVDEFLAPYEQRFSETLRTLKGRRQIVVKGRYVEQTVLSEILEQVPQARQLRERIANKPEDASRDERIALGELIGKNVEARRTADTQRVSRLLSELGVEFAVREPTHEFDAVHIACLVKQSDEERLREECTRFARDEEGRIQLRLLGPMAAYDYVDVGPPEGR